MTQETVRNDPLSRREAAALLAPLAHLPRAALAVSGGSDSTALMTLAGEALEAGGRSLSDFPILTVDHGLRAEARAEAAATAAAARRLGFAHATLRWRGDKPSAGLQEAARFARLDLMTGWCVANLIEHLVLAHTLDDQAETFLMRLRRNSGIDGLAAMARQSAWNGVTLLRPLLSVPRARLRASLVARGLSWHEDPSNEDTRFERVRLRRLMPLLAAEGVDAAALAAAARETAAAREALDAAADAAARRTLTLYDAGVVAIDRGALEAEAEEVAQRLLRRTLVAVGGGCYPPERAEIARLWAWLRDGEGRGRTLGGCMIRRKRDRLLVCRERGRQGLERLRLAPGERAVWDRRFHVAAPAACSSPVTVRALGSDGRAAFAASAGRRAGVPAVATECLASFWEGERLLAVPHLNWGEAAAGGARAFEASFCNGRFLGASGVSVLAGGAGA